MLDAVLEAVVVTRRQPPHSRSKHLRADAGYRSRAGLEMIKAHGYIPHVVDRWQEAGRKRRDPEKKARRWVVEVCHSWFNRFQKLLVRYEKLERSFVSLDHLAAAIIAARCQQPLILFTDNFLGSPLIDSVGDTVHQTHRQALQRPGTGSKVVAAAPRSAAQALQRSGGGEHRATAARESAHGRANEPAGRSAALPARAVVQRHALFRVDVIEQEPVKLVELVLGNRVKWVGHRLDVDAGYDRDFRPPRDAAGFYPTVIPLLQRTSRHQGAVKRALTIDLVKLMNKGRPSGRRAVISLALCHAAFEHAVSQRVLLAEGLSGTAMAVSVSSRMIRVATPV